ncbi:hypothetical protein SEA_ALEEMILY_80 [Gordonia phage Aleemily]|uniref:Uncharacterized protein n=1 Tax=Gordonia phage Aleemily TaxID=2965181 RepID=A0A9E7QDK2_9CAUD|nr:hypothetical protein SEA_ALEEMILY_80 [Gordonia phage Aleemily]
MTGPVTVNGVEITRTLRGNQVYGDPLRTAHGPAIDLVEEPDDPANPHAWISLDIPMLSVLRATLPVPIATKLSLPEAQALRDRLDAFLDQRDPDRIGQHRVDMWQAKCTGCGYIETEYGDYSGWGDPAGAVEQVVDGDWFQREVVTKVIPADDSYPYERKVYRTVELLCLECVAKSKCEVCDEADVYPVDGHLVCEDHEGHDFE